MKDDEGAAVASKGKSSRRRKKGDGGSEIGEGIGGKVSSAPVVIPFYGEGAGRLLSH
jgi:hypothetical protein